MADPVRDFLMDSNGDRAIVDGDFATVAGAAAVPQGIRVRVQTFLGEIWVDESQGVDWLGSVLIKNPDPLTVRELIREAIVNAPDVVDAVGSQVQVDSARNGSVSYQASTAYSSSPVVDAFGIPGT